MKFNGGGVLPLLTCSTPTVNCSLSYWTPKTFEHQNLPVIKARPPAAQEKLWEEDSAPLLTSRLPCNISLSQSLLWEEEGARLMRTRWRAKPGRVCQGTLQGRPTDMVSQASVPHASCGNSRSILYIHRFYSSKETTLARRINITTVLSPRKPGLHPFPSTNIGHISDFPLLVRGKSYPEGI